MDRLLEAKVLQNVFYIYSFFKYFLPKQLTNEKSGKGIHLKKAITLVVLIIQSTSAANSSVLMD